MILLRDSDATSKELSLLAALKGLGTDCGIEFVGNRLLFTLNCVINLGAPIVTLLGRRLSRFLLLAEEGLGVTFGAYDMRWLSSLPLKLLSIFLSRNLTKTPNHGMNDCTWDVTGDTPTKMNLSNLSVKCIDLLCDQ